MSFPRFRVRTLMIAVAAVGAVLLTIRSVDVSSDTSPTAQALSISSDPLSIGAGAVLLVIAVTLLARGSRSS